MKTASIGRGSKKNQMQIRIVALTVFLFTFFSSIIIIVLFLIVDLSERAFQRNTFSVSVTFFLEVDIP